MAISKSQARDFTTYARNPETWLLCARRHLAVAELLFKRVAELRMQQDHSIDEFSGCHYAGYLHAGLAVENAAKAGLISNDPSIVLPGGLDREKLGKRMGHGLLGLVESVLEGLSEIERRLLTKLEEHVVWAGKYTVPMKADVLYDDAALNTMRSSPLNEWKILQSLIARLHAKAMYK